MTAAARAGLLCAVLLPAVNLAAADPLTDLLPPPVRQTDKRTIGGGGDVNDRMYYFDKRGGAGRAGAAFSPDGKYLALANPYAGTILWDVAAGRNLGTVGSGDRGEGSTVAFAPDGKRFVTVGWAAGRHSGFPVTLWDAKKREKIRSLDEDVNDTLFFSAAFSPDGKTLLLGGGMTRRGGGNASLHFWDAETGDEIRRLDGVVIADPARRQSSILQALAWSPDGRTIAVLADGKVVLVETATSKVRSQFSAGTPAQDMRVEMMMMRGEWFAGGAVAFSPDGRILAVGGGDGTVRRFDVRSGRELPPLVGHANSIAALCFTPDGKSLLSLGIDQKLFTWPADVNRDWRPKTTPLTEPALERLWDTLRNDDPLDLYGCTQVLTASPGPVVAFLRKRLTPVPRGDTARIDKLVGDLSKEYNDRKKAARELREIGPAALPALRQAADGAQDDLARRLLVEIESVAQPREQTRALRALEVLERIASDDARALLGELAKGAEEAPFTVEAKAALERAGKVTAAGPAPKVEALWEQLGSDDGARAFEATRQLAARAETLPFLTDRVRELAASDAFENDPERVAKMIADLDSDDFDTREKAGKDLKTLGKLAEPALKKALEGKLSAEAKRQVKEALAEIGKQTQSADGLRAARALETLEWIGTPEARKVLETTAKTARAQWLREAAAASLRRLAP
jgi:hypothetical protein